MEYKSVTQVSKDFLMSFNEAEERVIRHLIIKLLQDIPLETLLKAFNVKKLDLFAKDIKFEELGELEKMKIKQLTQYITVEYECSFKTPNND